MIRKELIAIIIFTMVFSACGGGGGGYGSGGSDDSSADSSSASSSGEQSPPPANSAQVLQTVTVTRNVVETIGSSVSQQGSAANARIFNFDLGNLDTISCEQGGSASIQGTATVDVTASVRTFNYDFVANLQSCDGLSGDLPGSGSGNGSGGVVDQTSTISGVLTDASCRYTITSLTEKATIYFTSGQAVGTVSGQVTADCGRVQVVCNWQEVDLNNSAALSAGCN